MIFIFGKSQTCLSVRWVNTRMVWIQLATMEPRFFIELMVKARSKFSWLLVFFVFLDIFQCFSYLGFTLYNFFFVCGWFFVSEWFKGLAGTHSSWDPQIKALAGTITPNDPESPAGDRSSGEGGGMEVCAFDNRGMGLSSVPTKKSEYT